MIIRTRSPEKIFANVCKFWSITFFVINDICILKLFLTVTARKSFLGLWKKYLDFENIYIVNHIYCKSYVNSYPVYINLLTFCLIYFGMTHLLYLSFPFILYGNAKVWCHKSQVEFSFNTQPMFDKKRFDCV